MLLQSSILALQLFSVPLQTCFLIEFITHKLPCFGTKTIVQSISSLNLDNHCVHKYLSETISPSSP
uniref:Uncharacterized protein n=1 Tax=Rhizophora mucronata TaxID=61149 RepID=A0A2P2P223_RHIMU